MSFMKKEKGKNDAYANIKFYIFLVFFYIKTKNFFNYLLIISFLFYFYLVLFYN